MGRTGAKPTLGRGGAVFRTLTGPPAPVPGACVPRDGALTAGVSADVGCVCCPMTTTVIARVSPAIPSRTVNFDVACMGQLYHRPSSRHRVSHDADSSLRISPRLLSLAWGQPEILLRRRMLAAPRRAYFRTQP